MIETIIFTVVVGLVLADYLLRILFKGCNIETHWEFDENGDNEPMTDRELENKQKAVK